MSGTSLDGMDIAACRFSNSLLSKSPYSFEIICAETIKYSSNWKEKLMNAYFQDSTQIKKLHIEYGKYIGKEINQFIHQHNLQVNLIGSHGHTIFHRPHDKYTLQIGDGDQIQKITNIPVVSNFRKQDIQLGGQGAPLVPIGDALLFNEYSFCLNLGGFSNVSWEESKVRLACDISPCNFLLNSLSAFVGKAYDNDGLMSSTGTIIEPLLNKWNALKFYKEKEPKSLGREWFEKNIQNDLDRDLYSVKDLLRTSTEHIAKQVSGWLRIKNDRKQFSKVLITGGGTHNNFLLHQIKENLNQEIECCVPEAIVIDFKEAMIFAFLAYLRLLGKVNVLSSVTGAYQDHSSGDIFL